MLAVDCLVAALIAVAGALQVAGEDSAVHKQRDGPGPQSISPPPTAPGPISMPPSSSTATSSAPLSSPSLQTSFTFKSIANMTTCTPANITWTYSGSPGTVSLSITNIGVTQSNEKSSSHLPRQNSGIQQSLGSSNAAAEYWDWTMVNVAQGWYEIQGSVSGSDITTNTSSPQFFVSNGTNLACLSTSPATTSTSGVPTISTAQSSAPSPKNNTSAIVGGVVGGIVGVALLALLGALFIKRRRRRRQPFRGNSDRAVVGRWGSLTSNNSHVKPGGSDRDLASNHYQGHTSSTGEILPSSATDKSVVSTPGGSNEDVSGGDEKFNSRHSLPARNPFDSIVDAPFALNNNRSSTYSLQAPSLAGSSRIRAASARTSNHTLEEQAQRLRSSMDGSLYLRTERLSMPASPGAIPRSPASPTRLRDEYPPFPQPVSPVARSNSGTRRTPRKPVPQYDPSELQESNSQDTQMLDTHSTTTGAAESSQSGEAFASQTELSHKASFGSNRPVRYLIPDMPPPPKD